MTLSFDGDKLRVKAPKQPPPELIDALKTHKDELIALLSQNASSAIEDHSGSRPPFSQVSLDEASERINSWLEATDRLPKLYAPLGPRLKAVTQDFALGPWSYAAVQCLWTDPQLFALEGGLISEMSCRPLNIYRIRENVIVLVNSKGALEAWPKVELPNNLTPWWLDERCVGRFH